MSKSAYKENGFGNLSFMCLLLRLKLHALFRSTQPTSLRPRTLPSHHSFGDSQDFMHKHLLQLDPKWLSYANMVALPALPKSSRPEMMSKRGNEVAILAPDWHPDMMVNIDRRGKAAKHWMISIVFVSDPSLP